MKPTIDPRYLRELARYTGGDRVMTEALQGAADKITKLEAQLAAAEAEADHWEAEAQRYCTNMDYWREKVRVLREATQLALESAESWIHDQLDGTSSLQSALAELQPVRNALQATAPEQEEK